MFVPIHARRREGAGNAAQVKIKRAIVAAATAFAAGIASYALHAGATARSGSGELVLGVVIGVGAAALGLALTRAIGRQLKT